VRAQAEPIDRAATLKAIAKVLDSDLTRPAGAEGVLLRALAETPEDPELYQEIDRLAAISGGYDRYADALEERASTLFDAAVSQDLLRKLGKIAETELKDDRRAIRAYAKASEQAGDDPRSWLRSTASTYEPRTTARSSKCSSGASPSSPTRASRPSFSTGRPTFRSTNTTSARRGSPP